MSQGFQGGNPLGKSCPSDSRTYFKNTVRVRFEEVDWSLKPAHVMVSQAQRNSDYFSYFRRLISSTNFTCADSLDA